MVNSLPSVPDNDPGLRFWIHGLLLQTIIYGINIVFFFMCIYALLIHIFKAVHSHHFHKQHLCQNSCLIVYTVVIFALATLVMTHQWTFIARVWYPPLGYRPKLDSPEAIQRACESALLLVNWGAISFLLWRCLVHWKSNSMFPRKIMGIPYLTFLVCIATGFLQIIKNTIPSALPSPGARDINWLLVHWSVSAGLYYLLSLLIVARIFYHRYVLQTQIGKHSARFTSYLTIIIESGVLLVVFATAHLIILARHWNLRLLFEVPLGQLQVLIPLMIIQRIAAGKAWSGKTVDCLLQRDPEPPSAKPEEVSTMGFNPNTEVSSSQNDDLWHVAHKGQEVSLQAAKEQTV